MKHCKNILVAVDTSEESKQVLETAMALGRCFDATLSLIHVIEPVVIENSYDLITTVPVELDEMRLKHAEEYLEKLAKDFDQDIPFTVQMGSVKSVILDYAKEHGIDLIVVGSHGRHGLALLLGSTANALLHGAPCNVHVVRIKEKH